MKTTYTDFIGVFEDCLSKDACGSVVQDFENHVATNPSAIYDGESQFNNSEMGRLDHSVFAELVLPRVAYTINKTLDECLKLYADKFFSLKQVKARSDTVKIQKTPPRGGYHMWHSEAANRASMQRVLSWIIYLNDIPDGEGETEFLWQGVRVKPKAGTCVIWPAQFTHPHRGNPVYSCDKYIATGWYTYTD